MTRDGGAELGAKVTLKDTPYLAEKGRPSPPQRVSTLLSSLRNINTLINQRKMLKYHHPGGHPGVGLCPLCQEQDHTWVNIKSQEAKAASAGFEEEINNVRDA